MTHRPPAGPFLVLDGLTKTYAEGDRTHVVLDGADAVIHKGEFVALLGPSGSGKSTLLNLISGIDRPDGGHVRIGGRSTSDLSERERTLFRRNHLGFVFQFFNLLPTLTVEENLLLPVELAGKGTDGAGARATALLEQVGLADRADSFPDRLSGGEQQRVAICRALIHDPDLVLADEPTGNLDEVTGAWIMDLLDAMTRKAGKTLVVVTHSRAVAARADRILELHGGVLVPGGATT